MNTTQNEEIKQVGNENNSKQSQTKPRNYTKGSFHREQRDSVSFAIKRHIAVLSESNSGWCKELNVVSWNEGPERYDIRDWNPEHTKMGRGICLNEEEVNVLMQALSA